MSAGLAANETVPEATLDRLGEASLATLQPFSGDAAGEDPRYGERFAAVQAEVNRLSGTDFERITEDSLRILNEEAKDLRVVGYLALGRTANEGIAGFAETLDLASALIERFGDEIHPRRARARSSALQLFAADRVAGLVERAPDASRPESHQALRAAIERLGEVVAQGFDGESIAFGRLNEWLKNRPATTSPKPAPEPTADGAEEPNAADASQPAPSAGSQHGGTPAPAVEKPADDKELNAAMRRLLTFFRENERWSEHVAYARAFRWAGLSMPPAQGAKTRIPAPRSQALAPIDAACAEERWEDGLAAAEKAFLEPGAQFLFRIQRLGAYCARQSGRAPIADRIESEVLLLCRLLPGVDTLQFSDETPFADDTDRNWIDQLESEPAAGGDRLAEGMEEQLTQAREVLADDGLNAALRTLAPAPGCGGRELAQGRVCQARLCLDAERADVARPTLEGTLEELRRGGQDLWDRSLTVEVLQLLLQAVDRDSSLNRKDRSRRQSELREQLAQLDMAVVLGDAGKAKNRSTSVRRGSDDHE